MAKGARTLNLTFGIERFEFKEPFRIAGYVFEQTSVLVAELDDGVFRGRGEGAGAYYLGDDADNMLTQAELIRDAIQTGVTRDELQTIMPPSGARNAIDCAFWDLEAQQSGTPVWKLIGIPTRPAPLISTQTLGANAPDVMARAACAIDQKAPVKVKLTGDLDLDVARLRAIRSARPDAWIGVDANQGYDISTLVHLLPVLLDLAITQLEQPLARGQEADLDGFERPLPFVADESALTLEDVDSLIGRFDIVNIKLDKCGGLTEGLAIARQARKHGLGVMVGNMMGSSLSMAPSFLLGQLCNVVDLDGPIFLRKDRSPGATYRDGKIECPPDIWGYARISS